MGMMKKIVIFLIFTWLLCSCAKSQNDSSRYVGAIQIKGSDTIVNLIQVLAENFVKKYPMYNVSITGGGSGTGFASLITKTCDIAMSSRKIVEKERFLAKNSNADIVEFKIGLDGLAVLVNKNNPVDKLTLAQLRDIFMAKITNWIEVGGEDRKIVILSRESNSGTHMFFKERILRYSNSCSKDEFSIHSLMMPSSQAIYTEVSRNPNALGYVGMGFVSDKVKVVSIAVSKTDEYVYPTPQNVISGLYPISRPLYLYTNCNPEGIVKMFIKYTLSDEGQRIVLETNFVPIIKFR
jgi:phosphate transport system substrate-binding protein